MKSILRVPVEGLTEGACVLDVDSSNYVLRVHRAPIGAALKLFDPGLGLEADATLSGFRGRLALCEISRVTEAVAVPGRPLVLIQAYAKGDKVDRVVRDATALGATEVVIVVTERAIVHPKDDEVSRRAERFHRIAVEAARQCGRGNVPRIVGPIDFDGLCSGAVELPAERWVLSPESTCSMVERLTACDQEALALCIGPEGGLTEREVQRLVLAQFVPVRFADYVLRTETAATAVLGTIAAWRMRTPR